MRILITGAAGYIGRKILPVLLADPRVEAVHATDVVPITLTHAKLTVDQRDLSSGDPTELLKGISHVVHLAFKVERRPGEDVAGYNLGGNQRFLEAAAASCEVLLAVSSVAAYGLRDTPFDRLREDDPIAPDRGLYYCEHKIAAERCLERLAEGAHARIVIARPVSVAGPTVDPRRVLQFRDFIHLMPHSDHTLRLQVLHEADLGSAFAVLLDAPAGVYNVAPDDVMLLADAARMVGQWPLSVPRWLYAVVCDLTWRLNLNSLDADWVRVLTYATPVSDNAKLRALGWRPLFTTRDAVLATAAAVRGRPVEAHS